MSRPAPTMSLDELKQEYRDAKAEHEKRREFFVWAIYRPVSFLATPAFLVSIDTGARESSSRRSTTGLIL